MNRNFEKGYRENIKKKSADPDPKAGTLFQIPAFGPVTFGNVVLPDAPIRHRQ
jgi:hypothetical protein